jgi:hypothetical protein
MALSMETTKRSARVSAVSWERLPLDGQLSLGDGEDSDETVLLPDQHMMAERLLSVGSWSYST